MGWSRSAVSVAAAVTWSAVLGSAAGCASKGPATNAAADSQFLGSVHVDAPDIANFRTDTQLVRLGHAVCDDFQAGASYQQIADRLRVQQGSSHLPSADLGTVISSAVQAYCPRFTSAIS